MLNIDPYLSCILLPRVGGGRGMVVGGQVLQASVGGLGRVEVGASVAPSGLHLVVGVVVGVEEGRRQVSGGHRCNWKYF